MAPPLLLDDHRLEALGILNIDGLHVTVELLLGTLLVISFPRDSHPKPVWDALDTALPYLLVQLGVESDIGGTL